MAALRPATFGVPLRNRSPIHIGRRLHVLQAKVRAVLPGVADTVVVTGYAPQHYVFKPFV